jgi:hypothetical protein
MAMSDPIQPEQPTREFKNYSGDFLNIHLNSPDLAPSDFHLICTLKDHRGGTRFAGNDEVETEVRKWLREQSKDLHAAGFDALVKRWDKCNNVGAGYVEK